MVVEDLTEFLAAVSETERPLTVLKVLLAMFGCIEAETGRVTVTQRQIAKRAGVDVAHVNRALDTLVKIGALVREGRGRYRVYPDFMWRGTLAGRENALRVIDGGQARKRA